MRHPNEMEFPIVLHLVDAKGQLNSDGDRTTGEVPGGIIAPFSNSVSNGTSHVTEF